MLPRRAAEKYYKKLVLVGQEVNVFPANRSSANNVPALMPLRVRLKVRTRVCVVHAQNVFGPYKGIELQLWLLLKSTMTIFRCTLGTIRPARGEYSCLFSKNAGAERTRIVMLHG